MKKRNLNSILSRLLISFMLVITPVITAGVLMFFWEKHTIVSQIKASALDNVSFLQNNLESEVGNIKMLQYNLSNDSTLSKLVTQYGDLPKYTYYNMVRDTIDRLKVMKNSNNFIDDVVVHIPGMGKDISAANGYLDFNKTDFDYLYHMQKNAKYPLIFSDMGLTTISIFPLNINVNKPPLFLTQVILSKNEIEKFLGKFSKYNISDTALFDNTSGSWIFNTQSSFVTVSSKTLVRIATTLGKNQGYEEIIGKKKYYVLSIYSEYLNATFVQLVPFEDIFRVPDRYGNFLWIYALISIVIMVAYSFSTYKFVKYPINIILNSFRRVEEGDFSVQVQLKAANEFNTLFDGFNKMVLRLSELINKIYWQELYAKKSQLKQLQSQINPHFLYNSYFMMHRLIKQRELEYAESLSSYLGKYLQYITRNALDEVPLAEELEHARNYALIQQLRFSSWLTVEFGEIPTNYLNFSVPRIFLQPIIENSFEHGFKKTTEDGIVRVGFEDLGNGLLITVEDNGSSLQNSQIDDLQKKLSEMKDDIEATGIINVHRRIVLKYGSGSGITVSKSKLAGLRVDIKIIPEGGSPL